MTFASRRVPLVHILVRLLFRILLKVFFKSVVVEGAQFVPPEGQPSLVCSNHGNSITDAVLLVGSVPNRDMLRLTAKSTLFGQKTITSFVMESAGAVPIMRRKDHSEGTVIDNTASMEIIKQVLEQGDAVCVFPEGASRFHPTLAPLKSGVAWLASDILARNNNNPNFTINISLSSVNYTHRQRFRSDVLLTFHPPIVLTPETHHELYEPSTSADAVRRLTTEVHRQINSGLIDSSNWEIIQVASFAAQLCLSGSPNALLQEKRKNVREFVKICREFTNLFSSALREDYSATSDAEIVQQLYDEIQATRADLTRHGLLSSSYYFDDELPDLEPIKSPSELLFKIIVPLLLVPLAIPGLLTFWGPTILIVHFTVKQFLRHTLASPGNTIENTYDEIAHIKIVTGLVCGLWGASALLAIAMYLLLVTGLESWHVVLLVLVGVPAAQWVSFRILEEGWAAVGVLRAWFRVQALGERDARRLRERQDDLRRRVVELSSWSSEITVMCNPLV